MLNTLTNPTTLLIVGIIVISLIISSLIVRKLRKTSHIYEHHEYIGETDSKTYDHKFSSQICPICDRFDTLYMNTDTLAERVQSSPKDIGEYVIAHDSHPITHYFNIEGKWLGDYVPTYALHQAISRSENKDMDRELMELLGE